MVEEEKPPGVEWLDPGTFDSLLSASVFVRTVEQRQGLQIGCLEEIAFNQGFIEEAGLDEVVAALPKNEYREYLQMVLGASPYPDDFPTERHVGYVPESSLVTVEWFLPTFACARAYLPCRGLFRCVSFTDRLTPTASDLHLLSLLGRDPCNGCGRRSSDGAGVRGRWRDEFGSRGPRCIR